MSSLWLSTLPLSEEGTILFFSLPMTGSKSLTLFFFSECGLTSSLLLSDSAVCVVPLILGVLGPLDIPAESEFRLLGLGLTEELLLFDVESIYIVLNLAASVGFISNSLGNDTLKIESVGILGVDN